MPEPGTAWRHVILSTLSSWLPGDPRGWRSRRHKRHSSGDYRNPPPEGEHAGLHEYSKRISSGPVTITRNVRAMIGCALVRTLLDDGHRVLCASVGGRHAHVLVELPDNMPLMRKIVGKAKNRSSRAIKKEMPGRVWGAGGTFKRVRDRSHQVEVFHYILDHASQGAWTWSYREGEPGE